ncbi:MAG: transcriptional regulator [Burkholderiaceae bacterium]|nr:transcriptional regulator [Burkholderiaceae bacterium]
MNFQQLRIIRETIRCNYNLTDVGNALFTSQSGVSKHIKDLEDELGVELFVRKGKRLLGLTEPGKELLEIVERMLLDAKNIKQLAQQFVNCDQGQLTIATTHSQARYALPPVVAQFKQAYPDVHLALHQCSPGEIVKMLQEGRADFGIATESLANVPGLVAFPYYSWRHAAIVPKGHPLESKQDLSLADLAAYPIITYHEGFTGRQNIDSVFEQAGIKPNIVISALDADVIKTYVELGLGIGIVASMAYDAERDGRLSLIGAHLFDSNTTRIAVRQGHYLRGFAYRFIQLCSAELDEATVRHQLSPARELEAA